MSRFKVLASLMLAFLFVQPIAAQDVLPRELGAQEDFVFTGTQGSSSFGAGATVGPYNGLMTSMPGSPAITLYCVDFVNSISTSKTPTANVTKLDDPPTVDMSNTRLGISGVSNVDAFARYRRAAFLASLFASTPQIAGTSGWGGLHAAIWSITTGTEYYGTTGSDRYALGADFRGLATAGQADFDNFDMTGWAILTDEKALLGSPTSLRGQYGVQEYLVYTVTPEPATIVLMASGLLMMLFVHRRRRDGIENA